MARLLPALIGFVIVLVGFAVSSGIVTFLGAALICVAVLWFVLAGNGTHLDRKARR